MPDLVRISEAKDLANCTGQTLRNAFLKGTLKGVLVNNVLHVSKAEIKRWLKNRPKSQRKLGSKNWECLK